MPPKRKRGFAVVEAFDPNKSDSDDENFEPQSGRHTSRRFKTGSRRSQARKSTTRRKPRGYRGSDIDEDNETDDISDSELDGRRSNGGKDDEVDDDEEDDDDEDNDEDDNNDDDEDDGEESYGETLTGRRRRKAAARRTNYKETSESDFALEDENDNGDGQDAKNDHHDDDTKAQPADSRSTGRQLRVTLKIPRKARAMFAKPSVSTSRPRTRAQSDFVADADDYVELSASGKHAVRASKSPEPISSKPMRASKKPYTRTIPEAPEEPLEEAKPSNRQGRSKRQATPDDDIAVATVTAGESEPPDDLDNESEQIPGNAAEVVESKSEEPHESEPTPDATQANEKQATNIQEELQKEGDEADEENGNGSDDGEDEDDGPFTRRTRNSRRRRHDAVDEVASPPSGQHNLSRRQANSGRRTTRNQSQSGKRRTQPSSDFEPPENDSESQASRKWPSDDSDNGQDSAGDSQRRPRRSTRATRGEKRQRQDSAHEELDPDEIQEELHELRATRASRRRRSPSIQYERAAKRRRTAREVNYAIPSIPPLVPADDEDDAPVAPSQSRGRRTRNGWERVLNSTYGPFGGANPSAVLTGPWGTGAIGHESDSSDNEFSARGTGANITNAVGMTPTAANAAGQAAFAAAMGGGGSAGGGGGPPFGGSGGHANVGKIKMSKLAADADPLGVDLTVDFSKVGGLKGHIDQLKEMIQLPLLYPELFARFHVTPPRGVLFHGPPGTGKTMLARALANSLGHNGRKITFYMRKGADALSKWVGEAEKQLRLLFEEARRTQPSIIFFDEIDGLAPVRSSKQEQIHASIVSTLLALMDGMDGRGQVIVIGATNRPDNIDPALRRPGRFDREFYFPLPDRDARLAILDIHTCGWNLGAEFKASLAEQTKGYGGADLRALCTEAALNAIQRTYPQIYATTDKLLVDPAKISVHASDFTISIKKLVPSSERSASSAASPLPKAVRPLLLVQYEELRSMVDSVLPLRKKTTALEEAMYEPYDDADHGFSREAMLQEFERARIYRPRMLIAGQTDMGQNYLASAILHHLEGVFVQNFDLATLMSEGQSPEQVIVRLFTEVKRRKPSIIFIPDVDVWYATLSLGATLRTFVAMLRSLQSSDPVLVLGTSQRPVSKIPREVFRDLFGFGKKGRYEVPRPSERQRHEYFTELAVYITKSSMEFPDPELRKRRVLEELPLAPPPPPPRQPTKAEIRQVLKEDRQMLNYLKINLQPIMDQINKKYRKFRSPAIPFADLAYLFEESDPDIVVADVHDTPRPYEIDTDKDGHSALRETATGKIYHNLETTTIEERLSNGFYARPKDFLRDIKTLARDARNMGDRDRILKANELASNVEVDVAMVEQTTRGYDWDALYARQLKRAQDRAALFKKRQAAASALGHDHAQIEANHDSDAGPVSLGINLPDKTVGDLDTAASNHTSINPTNPTEFVNGFPEKPGRPADANPAAALQPQLQPPATDDAVVSQRSALTQLPPGVALGSVVNDASTTTTKLSGNSHSVSSGSAFYKSNGLGRSLQPNHLSSGQTPSHSAYGHGLPPAVHAQHDMANRPAVSSPNADLSSSNEAYTHSGMMTLRNGSGHSGPTTAVRAQPVPIHAPPTINNLLNDTTPEPFSRETVSTGGSHCHPDTQSGPLSSNEQSIPTTDGDVDKRVLSMSARMPGSEPSRPHKSQDLQGNNLPTGQSFQSLYIPATDGSIAAWVKTAARITSGCNVEQLEQIYREIMDELWRQRSERNRNKVLNELRLIIEGMVAELEGQNELGNLTQEPADMLTQMLV